MKDRLGSSYLILEFLISLDFFDFVRNLYHEECKVRSKILII